MEDILSLEGIDGNVPEIAPEIGPEQLCYQNVLYPLMSRLVRRKTASLVCSIRGVQMVVSDASEGLKKSLQTVMPSVPWQRCQYHLHINAQAYVPKVTMRGKVAADLRQIFSAADRAEADRK